MSFGETRGIVRENMVISVSGIIFREWYHIVRLASCRRSPGYSMVPYCNFPGLHTPYRPLLSTDSCLFGACSQLTCSSAVNVTIL